MIYKSAAHYKESTKTTQPYLLQTTGFLPEGTKNKKWHDANTCMTN
jgi:hypothetical protein